MQPVAVAAAIFMMTMGVTLNPDGSGKAVVELTVSPPPGPAAAAGQKIAPAPAALKEFAAMTMWRARDTDAWSDVSVVTSPDGLMTFKGTAYFQDIRKFQLQPLGWQLGWTKDAKGDMALTVSPGAEWAPPASDRPPATDEEIAKLTEEAQANWKRQRDQAAARFNGKKVEATFRLPGTLAEVSGLKKEADGSVRFVLDMGKICQAADQLMGDAAYVRDCIEAGQKPPGNLWGPAMAEKVFGSKGPFTARVTGEMKPQFDYAAEVKAAKETYPKMLEKLGLSAQAAAPK